MSRVLSDADAVLCGTVLAKHGGTVAVVSQAKLPISHHPVLLASSITGKTVAGCSIAPPPMGNTPCASVVSVLPTCLAQKLTTGGQPVVLDTLVGTTTPTNVPPGTLAIALTPPPPPAKLTSL